MEFEVELIQGERKETKNVSGTSPLLEVIQESGMELDSYCGGKGTCGKCRAIIKPAPSPKARERNLLENSELEKGIRLACLHTVEEDLTVEIEKGGEISILAGEEEVSCEVDNGWNRYIYDFAEPSLEDQRSYLRRIFDRGDMKEASLSAIKQLEKRREKSEIVAVGKDEYLARIGSQEEILRAAGAAVDIGTTTVVVYLLDLETGRELAVDSFYNPQKELGADVISRIQAARDQEDGWRKLQRMLVEKLNSSLAGLAEKMDLETDDIYRMVFAGNTIMLHSFLGLNSEDIANSPFIPTICDQQKFSPSDLGLDIYPQGEIEILPSISGYVGGDIVADMLAVDLADTENYNLLVDIGTNGEVALGKSDKIYACSVAAGPSFEGGNISEGMAAMPGAADSFEIRKDGFEYTTIDAQKPVGICGSGLLDLTAGLLKAGVVTASGSFQDEEKLPEFWRRRYERENDVARLKLFTEDESGQERPLFFTQKDVRQMQLAKGAIRAGIEILMDRAEIGTQQIDEVYLVGGFANYLDKRHACEVGMIPEKLEDRIYQAGNGAGAGARMMLLNENLEDKAADYKEKTEYLELSTSAEFQQEFTARMSFPKLEKNETGTG